VTEAQAAARVEAPPDSLRFGTDFTTFWIGQSISNLGTGITTFALPLIIFKLTGSATYLAVANALTYLPFLLFGVFLGAVIDRTDRKRFMVVVNSLRAVLIASVALLSAVHGLSVWAVLAVIFAMATLNAGYLPAQLAAIPSLVRRDEIVRANGRVQASVSASWILGPAIVGVLILVMPVQFVVLFDAFAYCCSVASLLVVRTSFNAAAGPSARSSMWRDVGEGLRYVFAHPVLRPLALMTGLIVLVDTTTAAQLVLFAKERFHVADSLAGMFYTATGVGLLAFSLTAARIKGRFSYSQIVLWTALLQGAFLLVVGLTPWFWVALVVWAFKDGVTMLFVINNNSLRQVIVPEHLRGRVMSLGQVLSWSFIPLGSLLGGVAIGAIGNVAVVYALIGAVHLAVVLPFFRSGLARAEQFVGRT
jgi:MFS family permease